MAIEKRWVSFDPLKSQISDRLRVFLSHHIHYPYLLLKSLYYRWVDVFGRRLKVEMHFDTCKKGKRGDCFVPLAPSDMPFMPDDEIK